MALVSHQHAFIYLKTLKTGSTSTEMALQTLCAPPGTEVSQYGPAMLTEYGIVGARGDKYGAEDTTGWHGHMPAKKVARLVGRRAWSRYAKISSLRNPFDKAVSWYWFRGPKDGLAMEDPVAEFRAFLREKEQTGYFGSAEDIDWRVTHIGKRPIIDHYIRLEHLQDDFAALFERLGLAGVTLDMPKVKAKTRLKDPLGVAEYFDEATADILRRHQGWIFDAGGYSRDPADAGRASEGKKRQLHAPETVAFVPPASPPDTGILAGVKRLFTRRAG